MIDHLIRYESEDAAKIALPDYYIPDSEDAPGGWRGDCCIDGINVYVLLSVDPETQQETRQYFEGWFIWLTTEELLADASIQIAADYEAWATVAEGWTWDTGDRSWIVKLSDDVDPAELPVIHFDRQFGREQPYPF